MKTGIRFLTLPFFLTLLLGISGPTVFAQKNNPEANAVTRNSKTKTTVTKPVAKPVTKPAGKSVSKPAATNPAALPGVKSSLENLKSRNFYTAKTALKTAKKGAAKEQKKQYRQLIRLARQYQRRYFRPLNKTINQQKSGDYKRVVMTYQRAESKLRAINRGEFAPLFKTVDEQLLKRHAQEAKRFEEQRVAAYTKALDDANREMKSNARFARQRLVYAKSQMQEAEMGKTKVNNLIAEADYNIDIQEGDRLSAKGELEAALSKYYDAQRRWNTEEVREKIRSTRSLLYYHYLVNGDCQANKGYYAYAVTAYNKAKQYTNDYTEINARLWKHYQNLYAYGNASFEAGNYGDAVAWYDYARLFAQTTDLTRARERANNYHQHNICLGRARTELAAGNVTAASGALNEAVRYRTTGDSEALRSRINAYFDQVHLARTRLSSGDVSGARLAVDAAQSYVPQGQEAKQVGLNIHTYRRHINEARNALHSNNRAQARISLGEARKISDTAEARELSAEANKQ